MKIKFDIEATPQELRTFFGLPDVEPLQQEMMNIIRKNMSAGMEGFDPTALLKPWLPSHLQSVDFIQKAFWQGFQNTADMITPKSEHK
jgi:hypothetical protein